MAEDTNDLMSEEYLTTEELAKRIKMAEGTIRNLVWQRELKKNIHYLKPTPRKLLFIWSEVEGWLYKDKSSKKASPKPVQKSLINI